MTDSEHAAGSLAGSGRRRFLIGADDPAILRLVADRIAAGELKPAGGATVHRTIGSAPDALVVEAERAAVNQLLVDHPGLLIEVDEELPEPGPVQPPGVG
jgi:hypothetical protein